MGNVPKLRFSEYSDEWSLTKLSQLIDFKSGFAFPSPQMSSTPQAYQLIKMSNVYQNTLALDRSPSYWEEVNQAQSAFLLEKGDLVLTLTGTVGKRDYGFSVMIPEDNKFLLNQRLVRLRAKSQCSDPFFLKNLVRNQRFLYYFFISAKGGTGNQANVGIDDLKDIKLSTPTLPEQQKIAAFLTAVDTKIEQLSKKEQLLKQYKKGVMQKIFSQEIRFKADDGSEFPEWEEVALGELGKASMCKRVLKEQTSVTGDVPFFKIGTFGGEPDAFISQELFNEYRNKYGYPKVGDILISASGTIGRTVIFDGNPAYFQDSNIVWIDNQEHIVSNAFLYFAYKMVIWTTQDTTIARLYNDTLRSIRIRTPSSLTEQEKIVSFLQSVDQKTQQVSDQLRSAKTFKKGLLQQMFV